MNPIFLEPAPDNVLACEPLTCGTPFEAIPVANKSLRAWQLERWRKAASAVPRVFLNIAIRAEAWLTVDDLAQLAGSPVPLLLADAAGAPLAWCSENGEAPPAAAQPADPRSRLIRFPWQFLEINAELLDELAEDRIDGEVSACAVVQGRLVLGTGARLLPGVFVEGPVLIGPGCKVGPNSYLRPGTTIGANCHIGQAVEVKNSIVMAGSGIPHLSYCGDSIVGEQANLGAGTILANFRHDGNPHRSMVNGELVDTGLRKFGAIIGRGVHLGIHTSVYPGRKIWPGLSTRPGEIVQRDLH